MRILILLLLTLNIGYGDIKGTIYQDGNGNGIFDSTEAKIGGVTVNAYDTNNSLCDSNISKANISPNYFIKGCSGNVRLEFIIPNNGNCGSLNNNIDFPAPFGSSSKSSIQFTKDGETNDFGILSNDFYIKNDDPYIFINKYVNGTDSQDEPTLLKFQYKSSGKDPQYITTLLKTNQIGSTWGLAYSKTSKKLFVSAFLKRHVGLGVDGSGAIYMIDSNASSISAGTIPSFIDLDGLGIATRGSGTYKPTHPGFSSIIGSNSERGLSNKNAFSKDSSAFGQIGKVSLGDLEISDDGRYLYVVNLFDKKLYRIDLQDPKNPKIPTRNEIKSYDNAPWLKLSCNDGEPRPFGLKYYRDKIYVGVVCTGEYKKYPGKMDKYAEDLRAYVYEVNPTSDGSVASVAIEFPLNYAKDTVDGANGHTVTGWYNWSDDFKDIKDDNHYNLFNAQLYHPQPILSDIEIDSDGSFILSFMDRGGHQMGLGNNDPDGNGAYSYIIGGDILKTYKNPKTCKFELEANGKVGPYTSTSNVPIETINSDSESVWMNVGPSTPNGYGASFTGYYLSDSNHTLVGNQPVGAGKEFYWGDYANIFGHYYPTPHHGEGVMGGMALLPSSGEVMVVGIDPVDGTSYSGGVYSLSNTDGKRNNSYNIYSQENRLSSGCFGKSAGLGDIEIVGEISPVEIGNLVWFDKDRDGIQDAGESGIGDVKVELYDPKNLIVIATANTDGNGNYIFSTDKGKNTNSFKYNLNLESGKEYQIRIVDAEGKNQQIPLKGYHITSQNSDSSPNGDKRDSDGTIADTSVITFRLGQSGENNHSLDFGFYFSYCLGDRIWFDKNQNGIQDTGEANLSKSIKIELLDKLNNPAKDMNGNIINPITVSNGYYKFCGLSSDKYKIKITPPSGYSVTIKDAGTDDTKDNDIDPTTNESDLIDLKSDNMDLDIALYGMSKTGRFNVQRTDSALNAKDFALYTQIVGRDFDYHIVFYDANFTKEATLIKVPVRVDLINYDTKEVLYTRYAYFSDSSPSSRVVVIDNSDLKDVPATKKALFQVTYGLNKDGTLANGKYVGDAKQTFLQVVGYSDSNKTDDTQDIFSIRPDAFLITIFDKNVGIVNSQLNPPNNFIRMASGYEYNLTIRATKYISSTPSKGYNRTLNARFDFNSTKGINTISTPISKTIAIVDGLYSDANFTNDNVGKYILKIPSDTNWTAIDQSISSEDCVKGSGERIPNKKGLVGCNVITDKYPIEMLFMPHHFDVNLTINNLPPSTHDDFIYMTDMNQTYGSFSVAVQGTVVAKSKGGKTATNFTDDCVAQDTNLSLRTKTISEQGDNTIIKTVKGTIVNFLRAIKYNDEVNFLIAKDTLLANLAEITIKKEKFLDKNMGTVPIDMRFNIEKNLQEPINPVQISFNGLKINSSLAYSYAEGNPNHIPSGKKDVNKTINFYYARVISDLSNYPAINMNILNAIRTPLNVDIYCQTTVTNYCNDTAVMSNTNIMGTTREQVGWFLSVNHNENVDGNVTELVPIQRNVLINPSPNNIPLKNGRNGVIVERFVSCDIPYSVIEIETDPPLRFEPSQYVINCDINDSKLTGIGKAGHVIKINPKVKEGGKMDW